MGPALRVLAALLLGSPLLRQAAAQDALTCKAGDGTPGCRADAGASRDPEPRRAAKLLEQELTELKGLVRLYKERIDLLKDLQGTFTDGQKLDAASKTLVQALQDPVPPVSDIAGTEQTASGTSVGDFLVTKAAMPLEEEVSLIKFLPLRNPRTTSPTPMGQAAMPSTLLVAVQLDNNIRLFTPSGELAHTFSSGHEKNITHLAVSPLHDEYVIATADAGGMIRVHKANVRQKRSMRPSEKKGPKRRRKKDDVEEEKVSQHIGSQLNVTVQFNRQMRVLRKRGQLAPPPVTAIAMASYQGTKYFLQGDSKGNITVFTRNGTFHASMDVQVETGVDHFYVHLSTVLFFAGGRWGFVDLEKFEANYVDCPRYPGRVVAAVVDSQKQSRVIASDAEGAIWVFDVQNKRTCKIEHRFPLGATQVPADLASIRGFALVLDQALLPTGRVSVVALNMTHSGKPKLDPARAVPPVVWRRFGPKVRDWAVHRRYQQGDLLALLSENGLEIEIVEVLMNTYVPQQQDSFANFKLPVFAVAIVLVLGYQFVKGEGAFDPGMGSEQ